ncbi:MAG: hypothetical protein D6E12_17900 [Desulfovibrio sp.]|nr:MAG: hypothetical protein D6E12_17900 [Desulfovibrio sp.]
MNSPIPADYFAIPYLSFGYAFSDPVLWLGVVPGVMLRHPGRAALAGACIGVIDAALMALIKDQPEPMPHSLARVLAAVGFALTTWGIGRTFGGHSRDRNKQQD